MLFSVCMHVKHQHHCEVKSNDWAKVIIKLARISMSWICRTSMKATSASMYHCFLVGSRDDTRSHYLLDLFPASSMVQPWDRWPKESHSFAHAISHMNSQHNLCLSPNRHHLDAIAEVSLSQCPLSITPFAWEEHGCCTCATHSSSLVRILSLLVLLWMMPHERLHVAVFVC